MPKNIGPGPAAYMLPPTVGYTNHDISRHRYPMYSMGPRFPQTVKCSSGPGPIYNLGDTTRYGQHTPLTFTLKSRIKEPKRFNTPGPGTYYPENAPRMKEQRPPEYSMHARLPTAKRYNTPAPNQYQLPPAIGPKVPDKLASAAYSMAPRLDTHAKTTSPGPAQYGGIDSNVYKYKSPLYSMGPRIDVATKSGSPGPAAYLPGFQGKIPGQWSFGRRVDKMPYITCEDEMPCIVD